MPRPAGLRFASLALAVAGAVAAVAAALAATAVHPTTAQPPPALRPDAQAPTAWHLHHVAHLGGTTNAVAGAAAGDVVYAGLGARVVALDVRDPAAPVLLGESPLLGGVVQDLVLAGGLLYVAWMAGTEDLRRGGMAVLAVADPHAMVLLRDVPLDVAARQFAAVDGVVLVVGSYDRSTGWTPDGGAVLPIDLRTAVEPEYGERHVLRNRAVAIEMAGSVAYVLEHRRFDIARVRTMDVSDPMRPMPAGVASVPGPPKALAVSPSGLYVASGRSGLRVVAVEPEGGLRNLGRASTEGVCADDVAVSADGLILLDACAGRAMRFALDADGWPEFVGETVVPTGARSVAWVGRRAMVALGARGGVMFVDTARPEGPAAQGTWLPDALRGSVSSIALHGEGAGLTVADPSAGLSTMRLDGVGRPPRLAGHLDVEGIGQMAVVGQHIVANRDVYHGLDVVDVGNLEAPRRVGSLALPQARGVVAHPDLALSYVPSDTEPLRVVSLDDPSNPFVAATLPDLEFRGLVRRPGGLWAFDDFALSVLGIDEPLRPVVLGTTPRLSLPGAGVALAASDERGYALSRSQLEVIDLSDQAQPRSLARHGRAPDPPPTSIALEGPLLVIGGDGGLELVDTEALESAYAPLSRLNVPGRVADVAIVAGAPDERLVLAAESDAGLGVYRLAPDAAPSPTPLGDAPLPTPWPPPDPSPTPVREPATQLFLPFAGRDAAMTGSSRALDLIYSALEPAYGVALGEGVAYRGIGGSIAVVDLEQGDPKEIGRTPAERGIVYDLVVDGDRLFVAAGEAGLVVYSLADPRRPLRLGASNTADEALSVAVDGQLGFVAAGDAGLQVFDVSVPSRPQRVGGTTVEQLARRVWLHGGHAFLATMDNGPIQVFDVTTPDAPRRVAELGSVHGEGVDGLSMAIVGGRAYVVSCSICLSIYDVADPAAPVPMESHVFTGIRRIEDLAASGGHLYAVNFEAIDVLELSDPLAPTLRATLPMEGGGRRIAVRGNTVATAGHLDENNEEPHLFDYQRAAVQVVDAGNLDHPRHVGSAWPAFAEATALVSTGPAGRHYVIESSWVTRSGSSEDVNGAWQLDITDPDLPRRGERVPALDGVGALVMDATTGFAIRNRRELAILDMADPAQPQQLSRLELGRMLDALAVTGSTVLGSQVENALAWGDGVTTTVHVVDVRNRTRPRLASSIIVSGVLGSPATSGSMAWLPGPGEVRAVDIADPWHPVEVGAVSLYDDPHAPEAIQIVASGDRVWAGSSRGLFAIDGSDPLKARVVGISEGHFRTLRLLSDDRLLASGCGLTIFDVSAAGPPMPIASIDHAPYIPTGCSFDVWSGVVASERFYGMPIVPGFSGLMVFDLAEP